MAGSEVSPQNKRKKLKLVLGLEEVRPPRTRLEGIDFTQRITYNLALTARETEVQDERESDKGIFHSHLTLVQEGQEVS